MVGIGAPESQKILRGENNPVMKDILKFKKLLRWRHLPVFMEPEFMSSSEAGKMRAEGDSEKCSTLPPRLVILQSYLNKKTENKKTS